MTSLLLCWLLMQMPSLTHTLQKQAIGAASAALKFVAGMAALGTWVWWVCQVPRRLADLKEGQAALRKELAAMPAIICAQVAHQIRLQQGPVLDAVNSTLVAHGVRAAATAATARGPDFRFGFYYG